MSTKNDIRMSFLMAAMLVLLLSPQTAAIVPNKDSFKITNQGPLTSLKTTEGLGMACCDWKETATTHIFTLDVPGLGKGDIKIEVVVDKTLRESREKKMIVLEDRILKICGERKVEREEKDSWHKSERAVGRFLREFKLPINANVEGIKVILENGVLTVTVPKLAGETIEPKVIGIEESVTAEEVITTISSKSEM